MPTYIGLINYSQDGIQNIDESPARLDRARELAASMDCDLKSFYLTMGRYDAVSIIEAPDNETVAQFVLGVTRGGSIRTETLTAFTEDEYRDLVGDLPG